MVSSSACNVPVCIVSLALYVLPMPDSPSSLSTVRSCMHGAAHKQGPVGDARHVASGASEIHARSRQSSQQIVRLARVLAIGSADRCPSQERSSPCHRARYWECNFRGEHPKEGDTREIERFMRRKYEQKEFIPRDGQVVAQPAAAPTPRCSHMLRFGLD